MKFKKKMQITLSLLLLLSTLVGVAEPNLPKPIKGRYPQNIEIASFEISYNPYCNF